jgi:hypothetical protein
MSVSWCALIRPPIVSVTDKGEAVDSRNYEYNIKILIIRRAMPDNWLVKTEITHSSEGGAVGY